MKLTTFFGFRNGKLITVVESTVPDFRDAVDVDYVVTDPQDVQKQITYWKSSR